MGQCCLLVRRSVGNSEIRDGKNKKMQAQLIIRISTDITDVLKPSFWMKYILANHFMSYVPLILFSNILMTVLSYPHHMRIYFMTKPVQELCTSKEEGMLRLRQALLRHPARVSSELRAPVNAVWILTRRFKQTLQTMEPGGLCTS